MPSTLESVHVLIIYPQQQATDEQLQQLGQDGAAAVGDFLLKGGVIVLFEGQSNNNGTYRLLELSGVFSASSRDQTSDPRLTLVAFGGPIALGAPKPYMSQVGTVRFHDVSTPADVVVIDSMSFPVILHRAIAP